MGGGQLSSSSAEVKAKQWLTNLQVSASLFRTEAVLWF
jgi:hypothetical protein